MYSIIVATYNRKDEIQELLESVEKLEFSKEAFELIIVDDGSKDGTINFLKEYKKNTELNLRWLNQSNKGPGSARNLGMKYARGDYFIFVDSDCILPPHWLNEINKAIKLHHYDAFGGPDTCHESFPPLLKAIDYAMTSFIGTGGTRGSKKSVTKFYPRSFNMGISREIYDKIGGMGHLRHGQDMEYSARIYKHGFKVGLIENAYVYHKRRTDLKKFYKQIFNWGVARINLAKNDSNLLKPIHLAPATLVFLLMMISVFSLFSSSVRRIWKLIFLGAILIALYALLESFQKYHSKKVSLLSVVTLFLQVFAYGLGSLSGIVQSLYKEEADYIIKNYYK